MARRTRGTTLGRCRRSSWGDGEARRSPPPCPCSPGSTPPDLARTSRARAAPRSTRPRHRCCGRAVRIRDDAAGVACSPAPNRASWSPTMPRKYPTPAVEMTITPCTRSRTSRRSRRGRTAPRRACQRIPAPLFRIRDPQQGNGPSSGSPEQVSPRRASGCGA
jgi:hypothetical protein